MAPRPNLMTLLPPNPYVIFGIVTFIVASIAVRG
jgi:hypothetical protein